jgi:tetratricopeptide (TPR) repeat protein
LSPSSGNKRAAWVLASLLVAGCGSAPVKKTENGGSTPAVEPEALPRVYDEALVLMQSGDYQAAVRVLRTFSDDNPKLSGPYINLGIAYRHTGKHDAARAALQRAIELNPDNATAHHQLAILFRESGDFEAALASYRRALDLRPDYELAHRNLGILYDLYLQQPGEALVHYRKYVELAAQPDETVNGWIIDIERRTESAQARASQ